ncbi:hypothetical protein HPB47_012350, partial [Ixodes persulcatus]
MRRFLGVRRGVRKNYRYGLAPSRSPGALIWTLGGKVGEKSGGYDWPAPSGADPYPSRELMAIATLPFLPQRPLRPSAGILEKFGVRLGERKCAALAFADDLVIFAETQQGLQYLLEAFAVFLEERDFSINIDKSATLSMLGDGKYRRVKVLPIHFTVQGHQLPIIGISDSWAYLGVKMDALGSAVDDGGLGVHCMTTMILRIGYRRLLNVEEKSDSMLEHMVELETWREMVEKAERNNKFGEMLIRTRVLEKDFWRSALVGMVDGRGLREARTAAKALLDVPGGKTKTVDVELGVRLRKPTLILSRS